MAAALDPLDRRRSRRRATSSGGEWMRRCINLEKERPLSKATGKRKQKASTPAPELSEEIVVEILVRLPVKPLLRFKSVCKAWCAIISDPFFVRAHLWSSVSRRKQDPSFLISPHTLDRIIPGELWPTTFSNHIRFYQWRQGDSRATFVHDKDFGGGEFSMVFYIAHCDGLVLVPTDSKLYLFNPATREAVTLPSSSHLELGGYHSAAGLGLDPRTGKYKVVRTFYHSYDIQTNIYRMGMEVFTVSENNGGWREILPGLPYPVQRWHTAVTVKGFMFWLMDKGHPEQPPRGLLRLSLEDETFSVIGLPDSLDPVVDDAFILDVLDGELWLTARTSETPTPGTVSIWVMSMEGSVDAQWERRYSIHISNVFHIMALLPGERFMLWRGNTLYHYDLPSSELTIVCKMDGIRYQGRRARTWKNLFRFNVRTYTESLVRLTSSSPAV